MNRITLIITLFLTINSLVAQTALAVEGVTITVNDLDVSVPFYEEILGFKRIRSYNLEGNEFQHWVGIANEKLTAEVVELQLGDETIALQEFTNEERFRGIPLDSKSNDLWFQHIAIVAGDMEKAYERLFNAEVTHVSTAPQTLPEYIPEAAGIKAFYFQDPDGHILELIHFPKGMGNTKWQRNKEELFKGVDHTAIGIERTISSGEFYEDVLGLKINGHSENYGTEQEHLNQVFGARLLISGLSAKKGMGIEFLDYITPPGGRVYPSDSSPTDLWHWHTTIKVSDIKAKYKELRQANATFISKGIVTINKRKQFMIKDVDGHAIVLIE